MPEVSGLRLGPSPAWLFRQEGTVMASVELRFCASALVKLSMRGKLRTAGVAGAAQRRPHTSERGRR